MKSGRSVKVWKDRWLIPHMDLQQFGLNWTNGMEEWRVCDLVNMDGDWNWNMLQQVLPQIILERLAYTLPPRQHGGADVCLWPGNKLGEFSASNAYTILQGFSEMEEDLESKSA